MKEGLDKSEKDLLRQTFREEALELLSELETSLIELEKTPGDAEIVSAIFRAFHTLKGSGAMCGFDEISQFTHHIETIYDLVRNKKIVADKTLEYLANRERKISGFDAVDCNGNYTDLYLY